MVVNTKRQMSLAARVGKRDGDLSHSSDRGVDAPHWQGVLDVVKSDSVENLRSRRARLFGPLPTQGIWTALSLTRGQFFLILGGSIVLFTIVGGPVWGHLHDSHFQRIAVSYAVIPPAVAAALYGNGKARVLVIVAASAVIAMIKLVVTAALLVVFGVALSG